MNPWLCTRASTRSFVSGLLAVALLSFAACADNGSTPGGESDTGVSDDIGTDADGPYSERTSGAASVETTVPTPVEVGTPLDVNCKLLDDDGNRISADVDYDVVLSPSDAFTKNDADEWVPTRTGDADAACAVPALNLVDDSPESFSVDPGPPHTVRTELDKNQIQAGSTARATCSVFDEYGNPVESADPEVAVDAMGAGIEVDGRDVTIETADIYPVTCTVDGASDEQAAPLEVTPGLPANLAMDPVPKKQVYGLGEVVRFASIVTDQYGNDVRSAKLGYTVQPSATPFGRARWEFNKEGTYDITGTVQGNTKDGKTLSETVTIVVNEEGPDINCQSPADGTIVDRKTSGQISFEGSVSDTHNVSNVSVNGSTVNVGSNGDFSTDVSVRFGINFLDVSATDQYGAENSKTCAFLVSDRWHNQGDYMSDSVALELQQEALDDDAYSSLYDSLADVLHQVLNSSQFVTDLGNALLSAGTLLDKSYAFGTINLEAEYEPKNSSNPASGLELGTSDVDLSMDWVPGGIEAQTVVGNETDGGDDLRVRLDLDGTCNQDFWVHIDQLELKDMVVDLALQNGNIDATLQSVTVNSGNVDPKLSGLCGTIQNTLQGFLQDTYQDAIESELEKQIKNQVGSTLDDLFSSLDVSALGDTFSIQTFDGSGSVDIDFNLRFSKLDVDTSRGLLGVATKFTPGTKRIALPSKGVPLPDGSNFHDPSVTNNAVGASMYVGVVNHILHTLWRAGMFEGKLGSQLFGSSAPQGTQANLSTNLPPVARLQSSDRIDIMMGSLSLELTYPGIFDQPVVFDIGLLAETGVKLKGSDTLKFQNITISEFYFTPRNVSLDSQSRAVIESFLKDLFQKVIDRSLNKGLPGIPIPTFTINSTLANYGLPQGTELGITSPTLGAVTNHFTLKGNFGKK